MALVERLFIEGLPEAPLYSDMPPPLAQPSMPAPNAEPRPVDPLAVVIAVAVALGVVIAALLVFAWFRRRANPGAAS